jgi:hypothetical protein
VLVISRRQFNRLSKGSESPILLRYIEVEFEMTIVSDFVTESLILDLLEWLAIRDRSYEEVMEAWRTSCPKLPVWEDANDRALVTKERVQGRCVIRITSSGLALLERRRPRKHGPSRIL